MAERNPEETPEDSRSIEQVRRERNRVLGLGLAAFVVLVFFISIAKMS